MNSLVRKILGYAWASPWTLLGGVIGLFGLLFGSRLQYVRGVFEFSGGPIAWLLKTTVRNVSAMTLGHVILGQSAEDLEIARDHEHVHVEQYERWGPAFVPAYLLCSLYLFLMRRHAYWENPFEKAAYHAYDPWRRDAE